jgi:hypothetical protein
VDDDFLNRMIMCAKLRESDEFKNHMFELHEASVDKEVNEKISSLGLNYFDFIIMVSVGSKCSLRIQYSRSISVRFSCFDWLYSLSNGTQSLG